MPRRCENSSADGAMAQSSVRTRAGGADEADGEEQRIADLGRLVPIDSGGAVASTQQRVGDAARRPSAAGAVSARSMAIRVDRLRDLAQFT